MINILAFFRSKARFYVILGFLGMVEGLCYNYVINVPKQSDYLNPVRSLGSPSKKEGIIWGGIIFNGNWGRRFVGGDVDGCVQ